MSETIWLTITHQQSSRVLRMWPAVVPSEIGGNKFRELRLEEKGEVAGRDPLVETGDNKFEKLKLEDTEVVVGRGPLVEMGGNTFG